MQEKKGFLQRVSKVCGKVSFIAAIGCGIVLAIYAKDASEVFRASMGATTFFLFMMSLVLITIGNTNLPNLKIEKDRSE